MYFSSGENRVAAVSQNRVNMHAIAGLPSGLLTCFQDFSAGLVSWNNRVAREREFASDTGIIGSANPHFVNPNHPTPRL
jgi:hypothetical protein